MVVLKKLPSEKTSETVRLLTPYLESYETLGGVPRGAFTRIAEEVEVTPAYVAYTFRKMLKDDKGGFITRALAVVRQREEDLRQTVFAQVAEAATALREAEDRGEDSTKIAELRRRLDEALRERRAIR